MSRTPILVCLADVEPQNVRFIWKPYIPEGKLTLLQGDPEAGKTWVALALCASLTRGDALGVDTGPTGIPQNVLYMTAEDGIADTLRVRFDLLGGRAESFHVLEGYRVGDEAKVHEVTLADIDVLGEALDLLRPALVVVDPIQGYMGRDLNKVHEVRPILKGLAKLAEYHRCGVLAIRHLSKGTTTKAAYRGMGSIDFHAAARSVLLAGQEATSGRWAMIHLKSSLAPHGQSVAYELLNEGGLRWVGESPITAADLMRADHGEESDKLTAGVDCLRNILETGPCSAKEAQDAAREAGVSRRTLERAKAILGVESKQLREANGRGVASWEWQLPGGVEPIWRPGDVGGNL